MTIAPVADIVSLDTVLRHLDDSELLRAVVAEMNCVYPGNVSNNHVLLVYVGASDIVVQHPEWIYADEPLGSSSVASTLREALLAMYAAIRDGRLVPHGPEDPNES